MRDRLKFVYEAPNETALNWIMQSKMDVTPNRTAPDRIALNWTMRSKVDVN
jgi:diketogulonate reductase-like aldo/keto reductase